MTDPVGSAIAAAAQRSPWAPALAFVAGAATSIGPCVAPRFVAVAALTSSGGKGRWKAVMAFAGGLCASYVALGAASGFAGRIAALSAHFYGALAVLLLAAALRTLWSESPHNCSHVEPKPRSLGGAWLLGMSFAFVTSPCCTPVVAVLGSFAATSSAPLVGAELIAAYAAGHVLPLAAAGFGWERIAARLDVRRLQAALQTVSGALMLALAGYYGVLA